MRIFFSGSAGKRLFIFVFFLFLAGMVFAVDINFTMPIFGGNDPLLIEQLNEEATRLFMEYENLIKSELASIPSNVPNLARAFANTSVFSSNGASHRAYQGYKAFTLTVGFMGALQFPRQFTILEEIKNALNDADGNTGFNFDKDNLDIGVGLDVQVFNAQLGINTSFLLKNLYLGFKFSKFDSTWMNNIPISGFSFKTVSFGITTSYQLITQKRLPTGLLVWRGLNLGIGFIWQNTSLGFKTALFKEEDFLNFPIETQIGTINMRFDDTFDLGINTNSYIIPIEAMTSIRLLWFLNVALGAGVDIAFGSSNINARGTFSVNDESRLPDGVRMDRKPGLSYGLGGTSAPGIFNLKIMGAVGYNLGPIIIDIPVTYYFLNNGYSFGITLGLTF